MSVPIPVTGEDAWVAGEWFHVAVTYNGDAGAAGNTKLYWTRVDPDRTVANEIGSGSMGADLSGLTLGFGAGNDYRTSGSGNTGNLRGRIDEVRVSDIARGADDLLFTAAGGPGFEITEIVYSPATEEVTLTWNARPGEEYVINYSGDLTGWGLELADELTFEVDENPDDIGRITETFDIGFIPAEDRVDLFFRVEIF